VKPFATGDHTELASRLIAQLGTPQTLVYAEGALYRMNNNLWRPVTADKLARIVMGFSGAPCLRTKRPLPLCVNWPDVQGAIRVAYDRLANPTFFAGAPAGLAFDTHFVTVSEDGKVRKQPRKPDQRARHAFNFAYSKEDPRLFLMMLNSVFGGDATKVTALREFVGACLLGLATTYQRALIMVGAGGEGKSTVASILKSVFPPGTTTAVSPQLWGNEYRRARLSGKLLNYVAELPAAKILANDIFKAFVTGDEVDARHIREAPFDYFPVAGHLFGANELPDTHDTTKGFWRRFLVLRFDQKVETFPEVLKDVNIASKVIAKEKSQIVGWLIRGAQSLVLRGKFEEPAGHKAELAQWQLDVDQVVQFLHSHCRAVKPLEKGLSGSALYGGYKDWADTQRHKSVSGTRFGIRLRQLGYEAKRTKAGILYPLMWVKQSEE